MCANTSTFACSGNLGTLDGCVGLTCNNATDNSLISFEPSSPFPWASNVVPTELNLFPSLRVIVLNGVIGVGQLTGTMPSLNLPNLGQLDVRNNLLTGTIPDFTQVPSLGELYLQFNQFTGSIPTISAQFITDLVLGNNMLGGVLPDPSSFPYLRVLDLDSNQFSGTIPDYSSQFFEQMYVLSFILVRSLSAF